MKSGISEYSEALVYGLAEYYDITLLTDNYKLDSKKLLKDFSQIVYKSGERYTEFDTIIYNIGNNPLFHMYMAEAMKDNPGFIILHDFILYYLAVGMHQKNKDIFQSIYKMEGVRGISIVKDSLKQKKEHDLLNHKSIASKLPMNNEIIEMAKGIFVHSNYTKELINTKFPYKNCCKIELIKMNIGKTDIDSFGFVQNKFKIPKNAYVIGSVGFISETKQNELCCKAIKLYNQTHEEKIYYLMIGEGDYVDSYLDKYILKTNFLEAEEYLLAFLRCCMIFNLRYPTNGETSAALIQAMELGKPCVVTDIGWFGELQNNMVIKVPFDITSHDLVKIIEYTKMNDNLDMIENAKIFVDTECAPDKIAADMFEFMRK